MLLVRSPSLWVRRLREASNGSRFRTSLVNRMNQMSSSFFSARERGIMIFRENCRKFSVNYTLTSAEFHGIIRANQLPVVARQQRVNQLPTVARQRWVINSLEKAHQLQGVSVCWEWTNDR